MCRELVEALKQEWSLDVNTRIAVLSLFGMMNWIYTWYRPRVDADAAELARQMGDIFLRGISSGTSRPKRESGAKAVSKTAARSRRTASSTI